MKLTLPKQRKSSDHYQTPIEALLPLYPYIKKDWTIWEPACGKQNLSKELSKTNKVIETDIMVGYDFLTYQPKQFDCIITNPPYSIKNKFIERCYELGKPFALLVPMTILETEKRQKQFRENGIEIIFMNKRIAFECPTIGKKSSPWFPTIWLCHKLIGKEITWFQFSKFSDHFQTPIETME